MAVGTCGSQSKEQQLYMLELLVDRLNLSPEKVHEIGSIPLCVRLEFLDFPAFEVSEDEFWSATKRKEKQSSLSSERKKKDGSFDFSAGKSCFFPKRPNELVEEMRTQPLRVGVYKVVPKIICGPPKQEAPICKSEVPLSGCLCDQVAMAANDSLHLPKPYTLRNTWNLIDEQGTPSGTILLLLRLTCLGKSLVTQFVVQEKSFLFKNSDSANEFQCSRFPPNGEEAKRRAGEALDKICVPDGYHQAESDPSPNPRSVIGLAPVCLELAKRDGGPLEVVPTRKFSTHRVVEENVAPKINVNEAESRQKSVCGRQPDCSFLKRTTNEFPCSGDVCSGGLCAGTRIDDSMSKVAHREANNPFLMENCCSGQENSSEWTQNYFYKPRMRGGGRLDEDLRTDKNPCSKFSGRGTNRVAVQSVETLISGACKSAKNEPGSKPGCGCFGKLGTGMMGTNSAIKGGSCSSNKPCQGVDCLIRAFKETQDFVDSFGKVPGLAGLGLMDPAESPFFRRGRDDAPTSCVGRSEALATSVGKPGSSPHHLGLRSHQVTKRMSEGKAISTILPAPVSAHATSMHRNGNAFHADTISLASAKSRRRIEERSEKHKELQESSNHQTAVAGETGPCGAPRCKSRKKRLPKNEALGFEDSAANFQVAAKKFAMSSKLLNARRMRLRGKSKSYANLGPSAYPPSSQQHSYIRVSRRIMKLVNAMRDPRFCHGHKNCLDVRLRVPGNMGWLWNTSEIPGRLKPPIGWKPGAISKFVWDRLQEAKAVAAGSTTSESRPATPGKVKRGKSLKSIKSFNSVSRSPWARSKLHEDDQEVELPPTLHIHRKDGTYYVTMYPVKAENVNEPEMQEKVKPLQFKITKNKEEGSCSSSSTSDLEIEFSPPAAINRYRKKEPGKNQDTQVTQQEILDTFKVSTGKQEKKKPKKAKIKK